MPKGVYTSDEFLASELEHIFRKEWLCVGRSSTLARPGDYLTYEIAGEPILVVRDRDGELAAFSNVCLHRMSTLLHGRGRASTITCPYHGWTYGLDGRLMGAPAMSRRCEFDKQSHRLPRVRCEEWLGWIMVNLDPDAPPVAKGLVELEEMIADYTMEAYVEAFHESYAWHTNWKVLAENFMESYHLPVCHSGTIGGLSKLEEMDCPEGRAAFNWHTILKDESLGIAMAHPSNRRLEGERRRTTYLLTIYPNLLVTLTPGYFWYLILHPKGVGQVRIEFGGGMSADYAGDPKAAEHFAELKRLLDDVNAEDERCTGRVYRGICSDLATPGLLSHLERPNYDFANYLASRVGRSVP